MYGLPTWNKPSMACLASRFPYHVPIERANLVRVAKAEDALRQLGFVQLRVRHHGDIARIEVTAEDIPKLLAGPVRRKIATRFKKLGYIYVTLDLEGYRTGSLNEPLKKGRRPKSLTAPNAADGFLRLRRDQPSDGRSDHERCLAIAK